MGGRAAAIVALAALAGCGGQGQSRAATPRPPTLDGCIAAAPGVRLVSLSGSGGSDAAILGRGTAGVVLSNESDQDLCAWLPFARTLARDHIAVLLNDASSTQPAAVIQGARRLREAGVRRVTAVGASVGARSSLAAAARPKAATTLDGVVSLSGERYGHAFAPDLRPIVTRIRIPALFIATRDDPYGAGDDAPVLYRAARSRRKRLVLLEGDAHGTAMLAGRAGPRVRRLVTRFLRTPAAGG